MITKEAIEAGCAAIDRPIHPDDVERILTVAIAAALATAEERAITKEPTL